MNNTIRIARLKLLFIAAKVVKESNVDKVKYSMPIRLLHNSPLASEVRDCVVARAFVQSLIGR